MESMRGFKKHDTNESHPFILLRPFFVILKVCSCLIKYMWSNIIIEKAKWNRCKSSNGMVRHNPIELLLNLITSCVTHNHFSPEVFDLWDIFCCQRFLGIYILFKHYSRSQTKTSDKKKFGLRLKKDTQDSFSFALSSLPTNIAAG